MQSADGVCRRVGMRGRHQAVCVWAWGGNGVFNPHRGREASISLSSLNVFYSPQFRKADQKWTSFKGASACATVGYLSEPLLGKKREVRPGGWAGVKPHVWCLLKANMNWITFIIKQVVIYHNIKMQIQSLVHIIYPFKYTIFYL